MTARIAAFGYHDVTREGERSGFERPGAKAYRFDRTAFQGHLRAIAGTVSSPALVDEIAFEESGQHTLLTFDDGGVSALEVAGLLEEHGWRGHFFIVTSLIGAAGFLARDQIRELHARGHRIGSHSHTHPDIFRDLPTETMEFEWRTSVVVLEDLIGARVSMASIPGGDASPETFRTAMELGFDYLFTSEPWTVPRRAHGGWLLGRAILKRGTPERTVQKLAEFRGWRRAMTVRRCKEVARRVAPELYRRYVRLRTGVDPTTSPGRPGRTHGKGDDT